MVVECMGQWKPTNQQQDPNGKELPCMHVDSLQVLRSWMEMEKSKAISADLKTPTNSSRKRSSDGKVAKKRKAPRYWSSQDRGDYPKNNKVKEKEGNVEEIIIDPMVLKKYTRGKMVDLKSIEDKKLKGKLKTREKTFTSAAKQAARAELLLAEESGYLEAEGMERTYKFSQRDIANSTDISSASKFFELKLDTFGPYKIHYTRNGRFLLMGGQKGHLAAVEWNSKTLGCEFHVQETIRDVKWLHQETLFAVAQKKNVYIYDNNGIEIHCLKKHLFVNRMEFLPYHFLLVTVGNSGHLKYQDTSTGQVVAEHTTKLGRCDCMTQNPYNAIINLGHANGTVTMWSPSVKEPLVKMLTHRGPLISTAVDSSGLYMATSGMDGFLKIWDIRTYKPLHAHRLFRAAHSLSISQKGQLAVGFGPHVYVYKDISTNQQKTPYMSHLIPSSQVVSLQFCPFEDVLGVGHTNGFSSLLIPGSGEANFDALEANPYQNKKQRREHEVKMLLEKIQPDLITLDPTEILRIGRSKAKGAETDDPLKASFQPRFKTKGKGTTVKMYQRSKGVKEETKREKLKNEMLEKKIEERRQEVEKASKPAEVLSTEPKSALSRFKKKKS